MDDNNKLSPHEEDEDLEALRLAALQSLKKKSQGGNEVNMVNHFGGLKENPHFNGSPRGKHIKRGKFSRLQQNRTTRNGQFNGWARNSNLIAVPMLTDDENNMENNKSETKEAPRLILPQDRYCKLEKNEEKADEATSKFDRYNNSDKSDSDSDEDIDKSDPDEKNEIKRSNSLEALMEELENEIKGGKDTEKVKTKSSKKRRKTSDGDDKMVLMDKPKENLKPEVVETVKKSGFIRQRKWQGKSRRPLPNFQQPPPVPVMAFPPVPVQTFPQFAQVPMVYDNGAYVAAAPPPPPPPPPMMFDASAAPPPLVISPMHVVPPAVYERPLSPLAINTEAFSTSTLAPLSPRSAAFVLENRAIIEKRKRRSYSRSPSPPRFRRSKSPKRLSLSPKSPSRRRSLSPSPVRKVLPPRTSPKKISSIYERLGQKPAAIENDKTKKDKNKTSNKEEQKVEEKLDPVLEARRKKFERNEITMKEGVIRLKTTNNSPKIENEDIIKKNDHRENTEEDEMENDDTVLEGDDTILIDAKIDNLFSDEESDSDNEGRFKTKQETNQKIPILPFTKLINNVKNDVKNETLDGKKESTKRKRFRSRSPITKKQLANNKTTKKKQQTIAFPIDNRKIEIKIRNPAKYEKNSMEVTNNRKVTEVSKKSIEIEDVKVNTETGEDASSANINEGDLRAQLSRKRAERQKHPLPDVVPSRLLQSALQGVGFSKMKKNNNKEKDESTDGKLPIHLRLGSTNGSEVFGKKSRKHKNKGSQEQEVL